MTLQKALNSKNVDIQSLIEDWWDTFIHNKLSALKEIIELIFHTAGYDSFVFTSDNFPSDEVQNQMSEKGDICSFLEILSDDEDYTMNYKSFFAKLFNHQSSALLYCAYFIQPILNSVYTLIKGRWDSFRITATITGTEIMSIIFKEEMLLPLRMNSASESDILNDNNELLANKTFLKDLGQSLFSKVYRPSTKDVSNKIRRVTAMKMTEWTAHCPEKILESNWHLYVIRGIRDPNMEVREIAFIALFNLFAREVDEIKQKDLFFRTKSDLLAVVNSVELGEISMKILCSVIRFSEVILNSYEREDIYINIYDPRGTVACLAGQFLYSLYFAGCVKRPEATIYGLVQFNCESKYKSYNLLVDAIYVYLHPHLKWEDWYNVIKKADPEQTIQVTALFLAYLSKAIVDYVPKYRKSISKLTKEEMAKNTKSFTEYFSPLLLTLLSDPKIKLQPEAFCKIIKLPQYFFSNIQIQNIKEVVELICEVMTVSTDMTVIKECSSSLAGLSIKCHDEDPSRSQFIKIAINSLIATTVSDFLDYLNITVFCENPDSIENRMLYLSMFHDFDDGTLWRISIDKLENAVADKLGLRVVVVLMSVLEQLLVRKVLALLKKMEEREENEGSEDNLLTDEFTSCVTRYLALKNVLKKYLLPTSHEKVQKQAFVSLVGFMEVFGAHMSSHRTLRRFGTDEDLDLIKSIIECTTHRITTKQCSTDTSHRVLKPDDCCSMLKKVCLLFSRAIISISHFEHLLVLVGKNVLHDNMILNALKQQMVTFPNQWMTTSAAIFNALMMSLGTYMEEGMPLAESIKLLQQMLECFMNPKKIDRSLMRPIALKLYMEIVHTSIGKRRPFLPLLALLTALMPMLSPADVPLLVSTLRTYKVKELDHYIIRLESLLSTNNNNGTISNENVVGDDG